MEFQKIERGIYYYKEVVDGIEVICSIKIINASYLKGIATIKYNNTFIINDIKISDFKGTVSVKYPTTKIGRDAEKEVSVAFPCEKNATALFNNIIINAYSDANLKELNSSDAA